MGRGWKFSYKYFDNNKKWDLQVSHGLPGQVPVRNPQTGELQPDPKKQGRYVTTDQYALFKGKVARAGYISNYAFGYAVAAGDLPDFAGVAAAQALALSGNINNINLQNLTANFDNREDIQAIVDGYRDYKQMHPRKVPTSGSFIHK